MSGPSGRIVLKTGAATDVGRLRTVNQDSYVLLPDRGLYAVADGMGGHQGGEVASQLAVETLQVAYQDLTSNSLTEAIAVANHRIRLEGEGDPSLRGMGTTVVAVALLPDETEGDDEPPDPAVPQRLVIANVGDSRGYLFRDSALVQITEDHSIVADLVREGRITPDEADVHPQRNIVTRVLGVYETVEADPVPVPRRSSCEDEASGQVRREQVGGALHASALRSERRREGLREQGFSDSWDVLDQQVAFRSEADHRQLDDRPLAVHDLLHVVAHGNKRGPSPVHGAGREALGVGGDRAHRCTFRATGRPPLAIMNM